VRLPRILAGAHVQSKNRVDPGCRVATVAEIYRGQAELWSRTDGDR
jgi:hypothetical protein